MRIKNKEELEHITVPKQEIAQKEKKTQNIVSKLRKQEPTWHSSQGPKQETSEQQNKYHI